MDEPIVSVEPVSRSPISIFFRMFIWPRQTTRAMLVAGPSWAVTVLLVMASGARSGLHHGLDRHLEEPYPPLATALAMAIVGRMFGSLFGFFVFGWLYYGIGRALGGAGSLPAVYHAFARGLIPSLLAAAPLGVMIALASMGQAHGPAYLASVLVYIVILAWSIVSLIRALAEGHRYSSWASLGAFILSGVVVFVVVFGAVLALVALAG